MKTVRFVKLWVCSSGWSFRKPFKPVWILLSILCQHTFTFIRSVCSEMLITDQCNIQRQTDPGSIFLLNLSQPTPLWESQLHVCLTQSPPWNLDTRRRHRSPLVAGRAPLHVSRSTGCPPGRSSLCAWGSSRSRRTRSSRGGRVCLWPSRWFHWTETKENTVLIWGGGQTHFHRGQFTSATRLLFLEETV